MCNATQQLGWAFNSYYLGQRKASTACNFGGHAKLQSPGSVSDTCKNLLQQAGGQGTGTVTSSPSGTGAGSAGGGGGSGGSSSSKAAASSVVMPHSESPVLQMMCVVALALVSGFAAVLL